MRLPTPLDDLFKTGSHVKVLRALHALHALPREFASSGRELARRAGVSHPTAINVLEHLSEQGVVEVQRAAHANGYRLNPQHSIHDELNRLFGWEADTLAELINYLGASIAERTPLVTAAYLFGSAARSDMTLGSDVDVLVVCPPAARPAVERALEEIGEAARERFGNSANFLVATRSLASLRRAQPRTPLWRHISKEGITILPAAHREEAASAG